MKFKGKLVVSQSQWRYVYNSVLNFANEEILFSYQEALRIYETINADKSISLSNLLNSSYTDFQLNLILNSLTRENTDKLYKPKKTQFNKFNNRTTNINLGDFEITFDKVTNTVTFDSCLFEQDFNDILNEVPFIGQFINMIETIAWPKKPGPSKAIRGSTIVYEKDGLTTQFYNKGSNPPQIIYDSTVVTKEPSFLKSTQLKKVFIEPIITSETHDQPVHSIVDKDLL